MGKVKRLTAVALCSVLLFGGIQGLARGAEPGANPFATATLSSDGPNDYDGTGHGTPAQTFVNSKNGFTPGDNTPNDGVVASGDLVGMTMTLDVSAADARVFTVRYVLPEYLEYPASLNPNLSAVGSWITADAPQVIGKTVEVTYRAKRGVPGVLSVPITLRALDTAGRAVSGQVVKAEVSAPSDTKPYSESSSKAYTVVSAPQADLIIRPENYKASPDGTPLSYTSAVNFDQTTFDFQIYPRFIRSSGYNNTHGASDQTQWSGTVDVSGFPDGTTFELGGVKVTPVDGKVTVPKQHGSVTLRAINNNGWGLSRDGDTLDVLVGVTPDKDAFSTPEFKNNGDGSEPGQGQNLTTSTSGWRGSNAFGGYLVPNNNFTQARIVRPAPASVDNYSKVLYRPKAPGHTIWDEGGKSFAVGSATIALGADQLVSEGTELHAELVINSIGITSTDEITISDQWNNIQQAPTGKVTVTDPAGKAYGGTYIVQWFTGETLVNPEPNVTNPSKTTAGWVTAQTPPAGASAVRVRFPNLPVGHQSGAGRYTVTVPLKVASDLGDALPSQVSDTMYAYEGGETSDTSGGFVVPMEKPEPNLSIVEMEGTPTTISWDNPLVHYTVDTTVDDLATAREKIGTKLTVTLDPCIIQVGRVAPEWELDHVTYGDCKASEPGTAVFLVSGDGQWDPSNYDSRRQVSLLPRLAFDATVSRLALGPVTTSATWELTQYEGRSDNASVSSTAEATSNMSSFVETADPKVEVGDPMHFTAHVVYAETGVGRASETIITLPTNQSHSPLPDGWTGSAASSFHGSYDLGDVTIGEESVSGTRVQYLVDGQWTDSKSLDATQIKIIQPADNRQGVSQINYTLIPTGNQVGDTYLTWISGVVGSDDTSDEPWPASNVVGAATVNGYVYWDATDFGADRTKDSKGIPGVTVTLLKEGESVATTRTDDTGYYEFPRQFRSGEYRVQVAPLGTEPGDVPATVKSEFDDNKMITVKQSYSYQYRRGDRSKAISDTVNLGIDRVFSDVNFGFRAPDPHVDIQKKPGGPACNANTNECTIEWGVQIRNDGNTAQKGILFSDVINGDVNTVAAQYGKPASQMEFIEIAGGYDYSLGLDPSGNLWGWGMNNENQIGDGSQYRLAPTEIKSDVEFLQISAGYSNSMALDSEGRVWVWGGRQKTPVMVDSSHRFKQISAGRSHKMALDSNGDIWAWGSNQFGQVGDGTTSDNQDTPTRVDSEPGTTFTQIAAGGYFSLALDSEGRLWAWGMNSDGQLGDGTTRQKEKPTLIDTSTLIDKNTKFVQIAAGANHSLALDSSGHLWAWGSNDNGRLGDGTTTDRLTPTAIKSGTQFKSVFSSSTAPNSAALDSSGHLWTWGLNSRSQIGDGTVGTGATLGRLVPTLIAPGTTFTRVGMGVLHTLALDSSNHLWAWGDNRGAQLGDGSAGNELTMSPKPIGIIPGEYGTVLGPASMSVNGNISTRTYTMGDLLPGQTYDIVVKGTINKTKVGQVVSNQAIVSTSSNPKTDVTPPVNPEYAPNQPAAKLPGNQTCSADAPWDTWDTPGDQCDQVVSYIDALAPDAPQPHSVSGYLWVDADKQGDKDPGESPVASAQVYLIDAKTSQQTASTITDANGFYSFPNVLAGDYQVSFSPASGSVTVNDVATPVQDIAWAYTPNPGTSFVEDKAGPNTKGVSGAFTVGDADVANINTAIVQYDPSIKVTKLYVDSKTGKSWSNVDETVMKNTVLNPDDQQPSEKEPVVIPITVTITNDGDEPLKSLVFNDSTASGSAVTSLTYNGQTFTVPYTIPLTAPLQPGEKLTITGTLTMTTVQKHENTASVTAVGALTGTSVTGNATFTAETQPEPLPKPSITLTKTTTVDASGKPAANGAETSNSVTLADDQAITITYTVTNTGGEDLLDPTVQDRTTVGSANVSNLTCDWQDTATLAGIEHNVLKQGATRTCTATLPALGDGAQHHNTATVVAGGLHSGQAVQATAEFDAHTPTTLTVRKVDGLAPNQPLLPGAQLQVTKLAKGADGAWNPATPAEVHTLDGTNGTDVKDGKASTWAQDLEPGTYELAETQAPDGYSRLPESWRFAVTVDQKTGKMAVSVSGDDAVTDKALSLEGKTLTVKNYPEGTLPQSGANGLLALLAGGLVLTSAGGTLYARSRKRHLPRRAA